MTDFEPISFTYKNTKQLIELVQAHPCLWDRQALDYKDRLARDRAWEQIFEELDPQFKECSATTKHDIGLDRFCYYVCPTLAICLWDRQAPDYKDRLARDRAWEQIFEELDPQFKECSATTKHDIGTTITKKWYNIRDSYVKSLKPDYLGRRNRPYIHAELLRFLDDCYIEKINTSFLSKQRRNPEDFDGLETEEQELEETEPWEQKVFVTLEEEPAQKRARTEYSPEQRENKTNEEDIIAVLSNLIQKEEDEDRAFFKSITPSVKKLSENSKFEFRIEVLKLIKKLRAKDKGEMKIEESSNDSDSE
ncbi:uncharacterized protein LOC134751678 [Cydia strobilella]|uniref:uncharacterized protein LOC134751678 n=1 Tax=Cydia strobilella TaxID=1100964 RepID=UPI00300519D2